MTSLSRHARSWLGSATSDGRRKRCARPVLEALEDRAVPAIIPVTTFTDEDNGFLGGGTGVSLREAVRYSVANDVAQLPAGMYGLTLFGPGEDFGATGDLDVRHNLTIEGPATCNAVIDGQWWDRVIDQHPGVNLVVRNLEITRGNALVDPFSQNGGGIRNRSGILQVVVCNRIHDSFADNGGAISNENAATMRMLDAQVFQNYANRLGGGVHNSGPAIANMDRSAFRSNFANQGGAVANVAAGGAQATAGVNNASILVGNASFLEGGAIYNLQSRLNVVQATVDANYGLTSGGGIYANGGVVTIIQSALINNFAISDGGGVYLRSLTASIQNSTISQNYAGGNGGGIARGPAAPLMMLHDTVVLNVATLGAGIFTGPPPLILMHRSLVADNFNLALLPDDVNGALDPAGRRNVLGSGLYGLPAAFNALVPFGMIGPLGSCAGPLPAPAHDLLPGNPAINMPLGPPPPSLASDQKGKPRGPLQDTGACETSPLGPGAAGPVKASLDLAGLLTESYASRWTIAPRQAEEPAISPAVQENNPNASSILAEPDLAAGVSLADSFARPGHQKVALLFATDLFFLVGTL
jgi:hypothetical protein